MIRPSLLLLPGLMCDAAVWRESVAALGAEANVVVAEYGAADSLETMARIALLQAPHGPLVLAGHSMGGRVAFEIQRLAPERVAAMCVLDTGHLPLPAGEAGERERAGRMDLLRLSREQGVRAMAAVWARPMVHPAQLNTPLFNDILDMLARRSADVQAAQIQALLARPDATPVLCSMTCPLIVATGRQDGWSPPDRHEAIVALVPHSRLEIIEDCGHMSPMEQPEAVTRLLRQTLAAAREAQASPPPGGAPASHDTADRRDAGGTPSGS